MGLIVSLTKRLFGNDELLAGVMLTVFSYVAFFFPLKSFNLFTSLIFAGAYYLGVMLIGDFITKKLGHFSVIASIYRSAKEKRIFTFICLGGGAIFSLIVADLGGLWYFPYWSITDYLILGFVLGGWTFYLLTVIVCYEAGKLLLDKILPEKKLVTRYYGYEKYLYPSLLVCGVVGIGILVVAVVQSTHMFTQFHYTINTAKPAYLPWQFWILELFACVCIAEYVEYKRKRSSLVKDILHGYYTPLLAAISIGLLLAITNETQNLAVYVWRYANYPLPNIHILQVPLFIILTWPLQFIGLTSVWRALGGNASRVVFANDPLEK